MWDSPGSWERYEVNPNSIAVYPFTPGNFSYRALTVDINPLASSYQYKDISISTCPGDFSANVASSCKISGKWNAVIYAVSYSASWACTLVPGRQYYINIKPTNTNNSTAYDMAWS
jgi:hypothetical protein